MRSELADKWDREDPLKHLRSEFHIPTKNDVEAIYFCGNSLGLQPKNVESYLQQELGHWKSKGVEGHFTGKDPWVSYHNLAKLPLANIVGAKPDEVLAVGSLTSNLHFLLATFYQPNSVRTKVLMEKGAFPSDFYAVHSHMSHRGIDPAKNLIQLEPGTSDTFSTKELTEKIGEIGEELALVMLPGVQYYTGQFFDIKSLTETAHEVGALIGFDLAHAVGNVPLHLNEHEVDFAVWCSYKYLNSGPGGIGGMYINEKHASNTALPRLSGWWGHNAHERFAMQNRLDPIPTVDGWQHSNANVLSLCVHQASLDLFEKAGMSALREKSIKMTTFMLQALSGLNQIKVITPENPNERGCQLSLQVENGKELFQYLEAHQVICDWREPNVIRIAPVPMYNNYIELDSFVKLLTNYFNAQ